MTFTDRPTHDRAARPVDRRRWFRASARAVTIALAVTAAPLSFAQDAYPSKPIRLVVPYAPGGSVSALAYLVEKNLRASLGQAVVVDHRPGAATTIATDLVAKAPADGYTVLLTSNSHVVVPLLTSTPYDAIKDFTPIAAIAQSEMMLVAHPSLPANTLQEFFAMARAKPGQVNYASAGNASATHLAAEEMAAAAGIKLVHVPYKGSGPAIADLLGGHVQVSFQTIPVAAPHVKSGKLKALAVSGEARQPATPQVPTFTEAGLPNFHIAPWFGLLAPAGTPKPVADALGTAIKAMMASKGFSDQLTGIGFDPYFLPGDRFDNLLRTSAVRYAKLVKDARITLE